MSACLNITALSVTLTLINYIPTRIKEPLEIFSCFDSELSVFSNLMVTLSTIRCVLLCAH